jgi:hypothetical protein
MLMLIIFLLIIYFFLSKKNEGFENQLSIPDLSKNDLKTALDELNLYLINEPVKNISHAYEAIKNFNYLSYNNSPDITVIIPNNKSITQYLNWVFSDLNEIKENPGYVNNFFILGNLFNKNCIMNFGNYNCGPFNKEKLISLSNGNLTDDDFLISDLKYKNGIIHVVNILLDNSKNIGLLKKDFFIEYSSSEREQL